MYYRAAWPASPLDSGMCQMYCEVKVEREEWVDLGVVVGEWEESTEEWDEWVRGL